MTRFVVLVAAFCSTAPLTARSIQTKPDFSGTWILEGSPRQMIADNGRSLPVGTPYGSKFTLKQDDKTLVITDPIADPAGSPLLAVTLGGSPTKVTQHDNATGQIVGVQSRASGPTVDFTYKKSSLQQSRASQ